MENRDGWPESFNLLPNPFKKIGAAINYFFNMHQLSEVSDHFNHPLDDTFSMERERALAHKVLQGEMTAFEAYANMNDTNHLPPAA